MQFLGNAIFFLFIDAKVLNTFFESVFAYFPLGGWRGGGFRIVRFERIPFRITGVHATDFRIFGFLDLSRRRIVAK